MPLRVSWDDLLNRTAISGDSDGTCSAADIEQFEREVGVILPSDYKDYCVRFASGAWVQFISIYAPLPAMTTGSLSFFHTSMHKSLLTEMNDERDRATRGGVEPASLEQFLEKVQQAEAMIPASVPFAHSGIGDVFFWHKDPISGQVGPQVYGAFMGEMSVRDICCVANSFSEFVFNFVLSSDMGHNPCLPQNFVRLHRESHQENNHEFHRSAGVPLDERLLRELID